MPLTADPPAAVTLDDVRAAARALDGVAVRDAARRGRPHSRDSAGVPVALKCEQLQPIGAFKIRGAYTAISRLAGERGARGVITQSSGNHGQAVAFAAPALRAPRGRGDAGVHARRSRSTGSGGTAARWSSPARCARAEQGQRAEAIAREEGLVHDAAVRPPRRRRRAGHRRPRDPGAAARRRDDARRR